MNEFWYWKRKMWHCYWLIFLDILTCFELQLSTVVFFPLYSFASHKARWAWPISSRLYVDSSTLANRLSNLRARQMVVYFYVWTKWYHWKLDKSSAMYGKPKTHTFFNIALYQT